MAGGCPAGSGADTIELTADVTLTAVDNSTGGANGLPVISSDIKVEGNGFKIERAGGAPPFRLFLVASAALGLKSVTLAGGTSTGGLGGAVFASSGALVSLAGTSVSGSSAAFGGGILALASTVILTDSTVSGNSATSDGGEIVTVSGSLTLIDSTVADNSAVYGGGIHASGAGWVDLAGSTVSGNSAAFDGGGIFVTGGTATSLANSTFSGNLAARSGGALTLLSAGATTIINSTFSANSGLTSSIEALGSAFSIAGSVIGNAAGGVSQCFGLLIDLGGNLADDTSCGTVPATLTGLDAALADNGGPTRTHALLAGSTAIDAAGACGLATDQRGVARDDGSCDSGAYELAPPTPEELIGLLVETVEGLGLPGDLENALVRKLENTLASFERGNTAAAVNKLGAFVNQVEAQSGKKIPAAAAAELTAAAAALVALILA